MCSKLRARKKRETETREKTDSYNQKQEPVNTKPSIIWGYHQVVMGISLIETGSGKRRKAATSVTRQGTDPVMKHDTGLFQQKNFNQIS
jgi:hypothetical protein